MEAQPKTKEQLTDELVKLHQRITELETSETERKRTSEMLRQSEEKLRIILENTRDVIFQLSPLGIIQYVSPKVKEIYGYDTDDLIGKHLKKTTPTNELPKALEALKSVLSGKILSNFEINQLDASGKIIPMEINAALVRREGKIIALEGVMRDITERKRAEGKIRHAAEEWRTTFDSIADLVSIHDIDFKFIRLNKAFAHVFKTEPKKLIGKTCFKVLHGTNEPPSNCPHKEALETKKPAMAEFFEPHLGVHLQVSSSPIFNKEGEVVSTVHLTRDITERKRAEEELRQSYEKLRRVLSGTTQSMAAAIASRDAYTADHQRRVTKLACALAEEMGLSEEQVENIYTAAIIHDIGKIQVPAEILSKSGHLTETEFSLIKAHPQVGYDILKTIEFPGPVAQIVLQHHERLDGSGYPQGLTDGGILLEAKILAVADVVEAMASHRPYRPALGISKSLKEISKNKGVLYNTGAVDTCIRLFTKKGFKFD